MKLSGRCKQLTDRQVEDQQDPNPTLFYLKFQHDATTRRRVGPAASYLLKNDLLYDGEARYVQRQSCCAALINNYLNLNNRSSHVTLPASYNDVQH